MCVFLKIKKKRLRAVNAEWNEIFGKEAETGTPYKTDFNFDEDILEEEKVSEVKSDSNEIKEAPPPESNTNDPDKNSDDNSDEDSDALIKPH
jgi:hypothetical protein